MMQILLVEDDPGDVLMTKEALATSAVPNTVHVVGNGEAAVAFLRQESPYGSVPRPDLMLLDLNLPRLDGHEVLAIVKGDDDLRTIPVVILTTSDTTDDVARSYRLQANAFVSKPVDFQSFVDGVRVIDAFFLGLVRLPPAP